MIATKLHFYDIMYYEDFIVFMTVGVFWEFVQASWYLIASYLKCWVTQKVSRGPWPNSVCDAHAPSVAPALDLSAHAARSSS